MALAVVTYVYGYAEPSAAGLGPGRAGARMGLGNRKQLM